MDRSERYERGITDGLIRFSVGLEDINDLKDDFENAFEIIKRNL